MSNSKSMNSGKSVQNSLPDDIALKIASSLQVTEVCALGSCSRFWRDLCRSDCVWEALCKDRWPWLVVKDKGSSSSKSKTQEHDQQKDLNSKGWKEFYINKHREMARKAAATIEFVERALAFESIEVGQFLRAVEDLNVMHFGFKDVQMFFLKPNLHVLINLVGLHYCMVWLNMQEGLEVGVDILHFQKRGFQKDDLCFLCCGEAKITIIDLIHLHIKADYVMDALSNSQISERQVCIRWWKFGRWFYGFRLRDELHSRKVSLEDLAADSEILGVLRRGAMHEVLHVQIAAPKPTCTSWSYQGL